MHCGWIHAWCACQIWISKPGGAGCFNDGPGAQGRRWIAYIGTFGSRLSEAAPIGAVPDGKGETGLPARYSSESPAAKDLSQDTVLGRRGCQQQAQDADVPAIEVRAAVLSVPAKAGQAQHLRNLLE